MKPTHVLVTFSTNWADEMDIEGFKVFTQQEWNDVVNGLPTSAFPFELYFGTNESNEYDTKEELFGEFSVKEIGYTEYLAINKLFGGEFGHFPNLEYYMEEYEGQEEDEAEPEFE